MCPLHLLIFVDSLKSEVLLRLEGMSHMFVVMGTSLIGIITKKATILLASRTEILLDLTHGSFAYIQKVRIHNAFTLNNIINRVILYHFEFEYCDAYLAVMATAVIHTEAFNLFP